MSLSPRALLAETSVLRGSPAPPGAHATAPSRTPSSLCPCCPSFPSLRGSTVPAPLLPAVRRGLGHRRGAWLLAVGPGRGLGSSDRPRGAEARGAGAGPGSAHASRWGLLFFGAPRLPCPSLRLRPPSKPRRPGVQPVVTPRTPIPGAELGPREQKGEEKGVPSPAPCAWLLQVAALRTVAAAHPAPPPQPLSQKSVWAHRWLASSEGLLAVELGGPCPARCGETSPSLSRMHGQALGLDWGGADGSGALGAGGLLVSLSGLVWGGPPIPGIQGAAGRPAPAATFSS